VQLLDFAGRVITIRCEEVGKVVKLEVVSAVKQFNGGEAASMRN
jgi:hypothetical protein